MQVIQHRRTKVRSRTYETRAYMTYPTVICATDYHPNTMRHRLICVYGVQVAEVESFLHRSEYRLVSQ